MGDGLLPRSLTGRLVGLFTATSLALLGLSAFLLDRHLGATLDRESHEFLEDTLGVVQTIIEGHPGNRAYLRLEVEGETAARSNQPTYLRVLDTEGHVVVETPGMTAEVPIEGFRHPHPVAEFSQWTAPTGRRFYLLERWLEYPVDGLAVIQACLDVDHDQRLRQAYRQSLGVMVIGGVLLAAVLGFLVTSAGLAPLREIGVVTHRITAARLSERIGGTRWPSELQEIAESFDQMLERLEEAFQRISRFSDDLAHELRTPLSNLRGEMELSLSPDRSPEELREVLVSNLEEIERLGAMVEGMLFLARTENPAHVIAPTRLDTAAEVAAVLDLYEALAEDGEVKVMVEAPDAVVAVSDLFRRAVSNLVANALRYTPRGGTIWVRTRADAAGTTVEVEDSGPGVPEADVPRVFERLFRGDASRTASGAGSGLGLAIVQQVMHLHQGTARYRTGERGGACFELAFPIPPPPVEPGGSEDPEDRRIL